MADKKARLMETVFDEVNTLRAAVQSALDGKRARIRKALYPLASSSSPFEQPTGIYLEQKAERLARAVGIAGLEGEYRTAMAAGQVDLATGVLDWSERFYGKKAGEYPDKARQGELDLLARLQREHVETLKVEDAVADADYLENRLAEVAARLQMIRDGKGHYYTVPEVKAMSEREVGENLSLVGLSLEHAGMQPA